MTMAPPLPHIPSPPPLLLPPLLPHPPGLHYDDGPASPARRVLPVFVFDVSDGGEFGLLIDGTVKVTAFADMVVAVSSRAEKTSSHFTCRCGEQGMWAVEGGNGGATGPPPQSLTLMSVAPPHIALLHLHSKP